MFLANTIVANKVEIETTIFFHCFFRVILLSICSLLTKIGHTFFNFVECFPQVASGSGILVTFILLEPICITVIAELKFFKKGTK